MYDRRVVRGNTFAALVIPVSKSTTVFVSHTETAGKVNELTVKEMILTRLFVCRHATRPDERRETKETGRCAQESSAEDEGKSVMRPRNH